MALTEGDHELIDAARDTITQRFEPGKHRVGAALRTKPDHVYTAVHLETDVGRAAICAEPIAIGQAVADGNPELDTIVAVSHPLPSEDGPIRLVPPCGICRELIYDYAPDAEVILPDADGPKKQTISDLIPGKPYSAEDSA